jgi:serine/threonine protein kinase
MDAGSQLHRAPPLGTVLGERYRLLRFLGSGAIGAVYEAATPSDERVAVKVLLEIDTDMGRELAVRFVREARLASTIDSDHIVPVVDSGMDNALGIPYLVMPLLLGFDLDALLERSGALHPTVAVRIMVQACHGLRAAQRAGVVHRDIKPGNIFLHHEPTGRVTARVLDFGMAKLAASDEGITRVGSILGTPHYMSPEQSQNSKNVDHRSDVWGLAATLYNALTGAAPFEEERTFADLHLAINTRDVPWIQDRAPWVDAGLAQVVHGGLLRDVDLRCPSAEELASALEPFTARSIELNAMMLEPVPAVLRAARAGRSRRVEMWERGIPSSEMPPVSDAPIDPLLGRVLGKRYTLLRRLGTGVSSIYEGIDGDANRFAVRVHPKVAAQDPAAGHRFVREARALLAVASPHVVKLVDAEFDEAMSRPFLAMELLHGIDLARLIDKHGALPPQVATFIALEAARGLGHAHGGGIIHRDVRPGNLFLTEQPGGALVVKLTGFAFVKRLHTMDAAAQSYNVTRAGDVLGAPMYMSPEQARNPRNADGRSDVWSLGATLYHALSGEPPWSPNLAGGDLLLEIGTASVRHIQDVAPWVPKPLADMVHAALRRDPAARFANADEFARALASFVTKRRLSLHDLGPVPKEFRATVAPRAAPPDPPAHPIADSLSESSGEIVGRAPGSDHSAAIAAEARRRAAARARAAIAVVVAVVVAAAVGGYLGYRLLSEASQPGPQGLEAPECDAFGV